MSHDGPAGAFPGCLKLAPIVLSLVVSGCLPTRLDEGAARGGGGTGGTPAGAGGVGGAGMVAGPSAQFVGIYNDILAVKCAPCHVTNMPRSGMLDLGDATTAFTSLVTGTTMCPAATEKRRVVPGNADESYFLKKLLGVQPMAMGCGQRMPRTPMRSMAPACVDEPGAGAAGPMDDALPDGGARDAGPDAGAGDAPVADASAADAAPQPAPRTCLTAADIDRIRAWIQAGAR